MPQIRFTGRKFQSLPRPAKGQASYYDVSERGFGIRVGGVKTWFVKYVHRGRQRWVSLGQYPAVTLVDARREALAVKNAVAKGRDPAAERKADRQAKTEILTFLELAQHFIEKHAKVKKRSWRDDERMLLKHCRPWHGRRAAAMPADPCTGARRRRLPTGHPSRPLAGARVPPQVLEAQGAIGCSRRAGPIQAA